MASKHLPVRTSQRVKRDLHLDQRSTAVRAHTPAARRLPATLPVGEQRNGAVSHAQLLSLIYKNTAKISRPA